MTIHIEVFMNASRDAGMGLNTNERGYAKREVVGDERHPLVKVFSWEVSYDNLPGAAMHAAGVPSLDMQVAEWAWHEFNHHGMGGQDEGSRCLPGPQAPFAIKG
jgi:hypothetical protein